MTREEEIKKPSVEANADIAVRPGAKILRECCRLAFQKGAKWADLNPKSPWISTKEDLPCNHEELIFLGGLINGSETIEVFVRYESGDIWSDYMIYENGKWRWNDYEPDYWMIPPKLPKE